MTFEGDILTAHTPSGKLHSITCDTSERFGEQFTVTMHCQGCTVRRYTAAEYRALPARRSVVPTELPAIGTPITHAEHGAGTVKAVLPSFEGTGVVVMVGRAGEYLARPGTFRVTTEPEALPEPEAVVAPVIEVPAVPVPPGPWIMPSLFGEPS